MAFAAFVHDLVAARELVDGLGHEAAVEGVAGRLDLALAVAAGLLGGLQHAGPGGGQRRVAEQLAGLGHVAAGQVDLRRGGPVGLEEVLQAGDGVGDARHQRVAVLGVIDGGFQHIAHAHRAVVAQQLHPGVERAGNDGGQQAVAGDQLEAFGAVALERGGGGRGALAAQHFDAAGAGGIEHRRHFAGGADQVGLDHLQHEGRSDTGVERVAAALEQRHAGRAGQPMGGGHDTEGAEDFRASRKHDAILSRTARGRWPQEQVKRDPQPGPASGLMPTSWRG